MSEADISVMLLDELYALHHGYKTTLVNHPELAALNLRRGVGKICKAWGSKAVRSARRARKFLES
jgi:hypothetical protein